MAVDLNIPILVVDDYKTMIRVVRNLLNQIGLSNVDEAYDGDTALEMLREGRFGLVIANCNMAPMTGLDLLKTVRADEMLMDVPFVLITGDGATENVIAAKEAGVSNYIAKPFNAMMLKERLAGAIGEF